MQNINGMSIMTLMREMQCKYHLSIYYTTLSHIGIFVCALSMQNVHRSDQKVKFCEQEQAAVHLILIYIHLSHKTDHIF